MEPVHLRNGMKEPVTSERCLRNSNKDRTDLVVRFLPDLKLAFVNQSYCTCFQEVAEEVMGDDVLEKVHPHDRERVKNEILATGIDNPVKTIGFRAVMPGGEICRHRWTVEAVLDAHKQPVEYYAVGGEASAENDPEELWQMHEFTANASKESTTLIDTNYVHAVVNEAYCRALGKSRSEIVGRSVGEICGTGPFGEALKRYLDQCFQGREIHQEAWFCLNGGDCRCYDIACYPYYNDKGDVTHAAVVSRDITAPRLAERALRESEERFRFLAENTGDVIYRLRYDSMVYDYLSPAIFKLTGYSAEEIDTLKFSRLVQKIEVPGDQAVSADVIIRNRKSGKTGEYQADYLIETKSGEMKWLRDHSFPWHDESSQVVGSVGILTDVSRRKRAEEALLESEKRFRNMSELSPFPICIADKNENIIYLNQRFTDLFGYSVEDIPTTREWLELACPDPIERQDMLDLFRHDPTTDREHKIITRDHRARCKDDSVRDIRFRVVSMGNGDTFVTSEDMTDHKKMQEERIKASKLESIGVLAGGIAHDFNNILTAVIGNISLARMYGWLDERAVEKLTEAEKACLRAKNLTHQLLTFSRGGEPIKKIIEISRFLSDTVHFILSGSNIRCEFSIPEDLWYVECDEGQIGQVFNNLIINAVQAMPEGGMIAVAAENVSLDSEEILPLGAGNYLKISVRDQGHGIPEKALTRIFDPYFTTKHAGSGLGLSTAYSIIKKHAGYISVESEPGVGSCFHIYLPAIERPTFEENSPAKGAPRGQGKILVMDDEEDVLNRTYDLLRCLGYEVELARDGIEALELFQEAMGLDRPFDAIIMDITVPGGMGGMETYQRLREMDPKVKAIVSGGGSGDPITAQYKEHGFCGTLCKPYESQEIDELLRRVVGRVRVPFC